VASEADLAGVTDTVAAAFEADPLWSWALPDTTTRRAWWEFLIRSALRYSWVWTVDGHRAASVWIPPGGTELTPDEEDEAIALLGELAGDHTPAVLDLLGRFEAAHPTERPHYYLSLLGTAPAHRGLGAGMALLDANLREIDAAGMPAYLESSNPVNDARYANAGFAPVGRFSTPDGQHTVTTMWREPRAAGA